MAASSIAAGSVKVIGSNGQVSLGKQYAGRQVLVEEREPGVWLIRTASVVPDNERWLQQPDAARELKAALDWSRVNAPSDGSLDDVLAKLNDEA
jgi:hypothetical protein